MVFCRDFSVVRFVSSLFPSFISHLVMLSLEEAVDVAPGPFDVLELAVAHSVAGCAGTPGRGKGRIWPWACALCCCSPRPCHWGASPPWARRGGAPAGHFQQRSGVVWCPKKPRSVCGKEGGGEGFWKLPLRGPFPGEAPGRGCPRCLLCCGEAGDQRCLLGQPHLSGCPGQLAFPRSPPLALRPPAQRGHQAPQFPSVPGGPKVAGASLCLAPW